MLGASATMMMPREPPAMQGYVLLKKSQMAYDLRDAHRVVTFAGAAQSGPWQFTCKLRAEVTQQQAFGLAMTGESPGQPWRVAVVTGLVQEDERGGQDEAVHAQREQPGRRAVLPVDPAQTVDVGVADYRREGGHGADHGRCREADHPVPGHRLAPRFVAGAAPLDAVRGRISEPSLKQQG
jgi:hypothetical protein